MRHGDRSQIGLLPTAATLTPLSDLEALVIKTLRAQRTDADRRILALALIDAGQRRAGLVASAGPTVQRGSKTSPAIRVARHANVR